MKFKDYYQILGLARDTTQDEIKRAYRKLARKYHPDVSREAQAEERFKEVSEAYEALKDPEKRAAYDKLLNGNWRAGEEFEPPPGWDAGFEFSGADFAQGAGNFSDFFESLFGGGHFGFERGRGAQTQGGRGKDHHARIQISLEDAYHGATRTVSLQAPKVNQRGQVQLVEHALKVKIPAGVSAGQQIRLTGQGAPGLGGRRGDLYLEILFQAHRLFHAEGHDIYLTLPIAPWEAALGTKLAVPTLGGQVDVTIPAGSQSGQKLRLKGRGLPGKTQGDQYIQLQIRTPKPNTEAQRRLYQELAKAMPFDPRAELGIQ